MGGRDKERSLLMCDQFPPLLFLRLPIWFRFVSGCFSANISEAFVDRADLQVQQKVETLGGAPSDAADADVFLSQTVSGCCSFVVAITPDG